MSLLTNSPYTQFPIPSHPITPSPNSQFPITHSPSHPIPNSHSPIHPFTKLQSRLGLLLTLFITLHTPTLDAQTTFEDSLRAIIKQSEKIDRNYIEAMLNLALDIRNRNEGESYELNKSAIELSQQIGYRHGEARAKLSLGFYYRTRDPDLALSNSLEALETFQELQDTVQTITAHYNLRSVYARKNLLVLALEHSLQALSLAEATNDQKWQILIHAALSRTYLDLEDLKPAKFHAEQAMLLSATESTTLTQQMHAHSGVAEVATLERDYDLAAHHFEIIYEHATTLKNRYAQQAILAQLANLKFKTQELDSALHYIQKLEGLYNGNDPDEYMITALFLRTKLNYLQGNMREVISMGSKLVTQLEDKPVRPEWKETHKLMAHAYASLSQPQQAYQSSLLYQAYLDSLSSPKTIQKTAKLAIERTLELKQNEINLLSQNEALVQERIEQQRKTLWLTSAGLGLLSLALFFLYRNNLRRRQTNKELTSTLSQLKSTQAQLIHSEKMASLGELTAGIAHEIQNPLNFVNNFSDVSGELLSEVEEELADGNTADASEIISDLKENLAKINHHGSRASNIVQGMLAHSHSGSGAKEPTDINKMVDEYLRLAYHGLRAKDKAFKCEFETELDPDLPLVNVVPQDMGRVILNLINNAFYTVHRKAKTSTSTSTSNYSPTVKVTTNMTPESFQISVQDNGQGMSPDIAEKIFQPFFTTKPTGEGTGLGLSLSYDIVTKGHGGTLEVQSEEGVGSTFVIEIPLV